MLHVKEINWEWNPEWNDMETLETFEDAIEALEPDETLVLKVTRKDIE
jgi:hypothetical protein